jgi:ubiquinone/menaquinone biosynthesis C-methylase UbiE
MPSDLKRYTEANREAWNEVMPLHQKAAKQKWIDSFSQPGFVALDEAEIELLQQVGLKGKRVVQLLCNNGVELMSLKNMGADECVGIDISDEAINEANERASLCQIDCQFIRSDVYEIGSEHDNHFDIAYIRAGGMGWLPDLNLFFEKVTALLRPDGLLFMHEVHPISDVLPLAGSENADRLCFAEPYFKAEPYVEYGGLDYVGNSEHHSSLPQYWFVHTMSSVMMSLIENGIAIEYFSESPIALSPNHRYIEEANAGIPLSYFLIGKKKNSG